MAQLVACPECNKHLQVPDELVGKKVQCPECKHTFTAEAEEDRPVKTGTTTSVPTKTTTKKPAWEKPARDDDDDDYDVKKKKKTKRRDPDDEDDDDEDDRPRRRSKRGSRRDLVPHRGGMILAFGLIGLIGGFVAGVPFIFGIVAWVMGNNDLAEIRAGRMDPEGEGMTQAGRICGMIATILAILATLGVCAYFVVVFVCVAVMIGGAAQQQKNFPGPPPRRF